MKVGCLFLVLLLSSCAELTSFFDDEPNGPQTARANTSGNPTTQSQETNRSSATQSGQNRRALTPSSRASTALSQRAIKQLYSELKCPITKAQLQNPVMTSDGYTFERDAIAAWLQNHNTNPATGNRLANKTLVKNLSLTSVLNSRLPLSSQQKDEIFDCPISYTRMNDPVALIDGHTFNRGSISQWLRDHNTNPMTNGVLRTKSLLPNIALKAYIDTHS